MEERPPRRPPTPKRSAPNAIVRDEEEMDKVLKKIQDQELKDSHRPERRSRGFFSKWDKSTKRPPTPKRERDGPHAIHIDKKIEKAVKKIHKREHKDMPRPQDRPSQERSRAKLDKYPHRPPTPKKEQAALNAVVLDKNTEEVVRAYLFDNDPEYCMDPITRKKMEMEIELRNKEAAERAKSRQDQASPVSPQPGPSSPIKEAIKTDPKYEVGEALLTAKTVGSVAFPAASTADPIVRDERPERRSFIRSLSGRFSRRKKNKNKEEEKPRDPDSEVSVHTSHYSTSLSSELFEDRLSETYTPSSVMPGLDMTPSRLEQLSGYETTTSGPDYTSGQETDNLSNSFPSETDGAVGGEPLPMPRNPPLAQQDPRGRLRNVRLSLETCVEHPNAERSPRTFINYYAECKSYDENDPRPESFGEDEGWEVFPRIIPYQDDGKTFLESPENVEEGESSAMARRIFNRLFDELDMHDGPWDVGYFYEEHFEEPTKSDDDVKKGMLLTPDGKFAVEYRKNSKDEGIDVRHVEKYSSEMEGEPNSESLSPSSLKPSGDSVEGKLHLEQPPSTLYDFHSERFSSSSSSGSDSDTDSDED